MTRMLLFTVLLLLAAGCGEGTDAAMEAGARDRGTSLAAAEAGDDAVLRVLYVPAEGFAYHDREGRLTGVTVDIMRAFADWVAQRRGMAVELEFVEEEHWRTFYDRVRAASGGVFGLGNVTITEERSRELRFSPSYLTNVAVLITHDTIPELTRQGDAASVFADLTLLAYEGTLHEARMQSLRDSYLPDAEIELESSNAGILERVAGGCCVAYIDGYNFWRARDRGAPLRRHEVADDPGEDFGIIMPLGNDWAPVLEEFFERDGGWRRGAEYRAILVRHLGEDLTRALEDARPGP
jgi:ABC-type amino acid transport substrate-binding protein